jgi:hypothetical protein
VLILNGVIAGTWKRTATRTHVLVEVSAFRELDKTEHALIQSAAQRYAAYLQLAGEVRIAA